MLFLYFTSKSSTCVAAYKADVPEIPHRILPFHIKIKRRRNNIEVIFLQKTTIIVQIYKIAHNKILFSPFNHINLYQFIIRMQAQSKLWYLENFSLMRTLPLSEIRKLNNSTKMKEAPKNFIIYFSDQPANSIYLIKKGRVKISKMDPSGKEIILAILGPGEVFGEMSITGQEMREEIAEATEDTLLCLMFSDIIQGLMQKNPSFSLSIVKFVGLRLRKIQNKFESIIFKSSDERVKSFIRELADEHGTKVQGNNNEREVRLKLTHEDIAKLTATSRQTVTTVLNELEKQGVITYDRSRIFVKAYSKL